MDFLNAIFEARFSNRRSASVPRRGNVPARIGWEICHGLAKAALLRPGQARAACGIWFVAVALLLCAGPSAPAQTSTSKEYKVKAAFLYNFAQFVEWSPVVFSDAQSPMVIGVFGDDPFDGYLDELVRGEKVNGRALRVQRCHSVEEIKTNTCHVLFISKSAMGQLDEILAGVKGRNILTVGEAEGFATRGGMIRFATEQSKIRLRINVEAAKAANLTISSKLLRLAEIVRPGKD